MAVGIVRNPYAPNVPAALAAAALRLDLPARTIDISTLRARVSSGGGLAVADDEGPVSVTGLAPFLLFGYPAAVVALQALSRLARPLNPVEAVLVADDKAATAVRLAEAGVAQVASEVCALDLDSAAAAAQAAGYPVVLKRTHGAQGRWVRRARDPGELAGVVAELAAEGPGALIVQREVTEYSGRSIRALVSDGRLLVATERRAAPGEWRSNISAGGSQERVTLSAQEAELARQAVEVLGLAHGGVDLLRTSQGTLVLEVNACPDFTSMQPYADVDLAAEVLLSSAGRGGRGGRVAGAW